MKKKDGGFTLVELIVVLVILAILAAILIPSMVGWIRKSEAMACEDVRLMLLRELQRQVIYNADYDPADPESRAELDAGYACPGGGAYTITKKGQNYEVRCSVHGGSTLDYESWEMLAMAFNEALEENAITATKYIDSGASDGSNSRTKVLKEKLEAMGFALDTAWKIVQENDGTFSLYIAKNIQDNPDGKTEGYYLRSRYYFQVSKTVIRDGELVSQEEGYAAGAWSDNTEGTYRVINEKAFVSSYAGIPDWAKEQGQVQD